MRYLLSCVVSLLLPLALCAQGKKERKPGDEMMQKYLAAETDKLSQKYLDGAKTIDEWKQKRPRLHQEYMDMLGLWPIPEKTPLKATKTGEIEAHGVIVEKIHFQSKPGLYVTANLYRPKALSGKPRLPAILYVCGHSGNGYDGNKYEFQDHGFWFANNGYVCLHIDTLELGEIPGVHLGTYGRPWQRLNSYGKEFTAKRQTHDNRFWWYSIGYSPAAVECWNGVRAIDYLCTRPDVDTDKIAVTGISGGGMATFWIAGADDRVKVAVPVSSIADLESYVKNRVINNHCDCMLTYNTYQWEWSTIAALVAPRPMLFANSDKDQYFPMDANRRIMERLRTIYGMYGVPGLVDEHISKGGHDYRPDLRLAVFKFINKHLKGDTTSSVEDSVKYTRTKGRDLRVFPERSDVPKDAINDRIDETFIPMAKVSLPEKGKFQEWKNRLVKELRAQSFRSFPEKFPAPQGETNGGRSTIKPDVGFEVSWSPSSAPNSDLVFEVQSPEPTGSNRFAFPAIGTYIRVRTGWTVASPPNYLERCHVLLGHTIDERRVWDIISAVRYEHQQRGGKDGLKVYGEGEAGILVAYAALFEPAIKEVVVINPPKSHKEGPHFLNVLRVLDIPKALGLLAPTPLTIVGGDAKAFERTAEIYRLAGAADKLTRK